MIIFRHDFIASLGGQVKELIGQTPKLSNKMQGIEFPEVETYNPVFGSQETIFNAKQAKAFIQKIATLLDANDLCSSEQQVLAILILLYMDFSDLKFTILPLSITKNPLGNLLLKSLKILGNGCPPLCKEHPEISLLLIKALSGQLLKELSMTSLLISAGSGLKFSLLEAGLTSEENSLAPINMRLAEHITIQDLRYQESIKLQEIVMQQQTSAEKTPDESGFLEEDPQETIDTISDNTGKDEPIKSSISMSDTFEIEDASKALVSENESLISIDNVISEENLMTTLKKILEEAESLLLEDETESSVADAETQVTITEVEKLIESMKEAESADADADDEAQIPSDNSNSMEGADEGTTYSQLQTFLSPSSEQITQSSAQTQIPLQIKVENNPDSKASPSDKNTIIKSIIQFIIGIGSAMKAFPKRVKDFFCRKNEVVLQMYSFDSPETLACIEKPRVQAMPDYRPSGSSDEVAPALSSSPLVG